MNQIYFTCPDNRDLDLLVIDIGFRIFDKDNLSLRDSTILNFMRAEENERKDMLDNCQFLYEPIDPMH